LTNKTWCFYNERNAQQTMSRIQTLIKLYNEADFREKNLKLFGYLCKLLSNTLSLFGGATYIALSRRLSQAAFTVTTGKRLLWVGRIICNINWLQSALSEPDAFTKSISLVGIACASCCSVLDDVITLQRIGIVSPGTFDIAYLYSWTARLWMSLTMCTLTLNRMRLQRLTKNLRRRLARRLHPKRSRTPLQDTVFAIDTNHPDDVVDQYKDEGDHEEAEIRSDQFQYQISCYSEWKLLCDLGMNSCYTFQWKNVPDWWFSACGFSSSVLSLVKIWKVARRVDLLEDAVEEQERHVIAPTAPSKLNMLVRVASAVKLQKSSHTRSSTAPPHQSITDILKQHTTSPTRDHPAGGGHSIRRKLSSNRMGDLLQLEQMSRRLRVIEEL
jgi:hypothetical protein